ncbi:hypothetical protein JCM11491_000458 [Sporobolomyces phaffii]
MPAPIRLPPHPSRARSSTSRFLSRIARIRGVGDVHKVAYSSVALAPAVPVPVRVRPCFLAATFVSLVVLSLLGFHPTLATRLAPPAVPLSDKVLHFVCFAAATAAFYRIWHVPDDARKLSPVWRWWNEGATFSVCCVVGGVGSEFVQSLVPYKTFQVGDVVANLAGSGLALWWSWRRARDHRRDKELRRLYVRMDQLDDDDDDDDDDNESGGDEEAEVRGLIGGRSPSVRAPPRRNGDGNGNAGREGGGERRTALGTPASVNARREERENPWDDRDEDEHGGHGREATEIFGLGGEEDEEDDDDNLASSARRE